MMAPEAVDRLRSLLAHLEQGGDTLVIDADAHVTDVASLPAPLRQRLETTPDYYHGRPISAEDLLREMRQAEVDMALVWQNPSSTVYTRDADANYENLLAANRYVRDVAVRSPHRFIPGGWTDPKALGLESALRLVDTLTLEFGFPVIKMNPAQNAFPIDSPGVLSVVDRIVQRGAVPAFHFGADSPYIPAKGLAAIAARYSDSPILAVHMGGGGAGYVEAETLYHEARQLGLSHPNLCFALSARRDTHTESDLIAYQIAGAPFCHHLFCASDAPYGRVTWNFGGYRALLASFLDSEHHPDPRIRERPGLFDQAAVRGYLGGNLARMVVATIRRLLARHAADGMI